MFRRDTPSRPCRRRFPVAALWAVFFLNGAVLSSWAPRIPEVQSRLALSDAALGGALFGVAAGAVPGLLLARRLLRRVSSRRACMAAATVFCAALPLIPIASGAVALSVILALLGAASGVLDIAMNTAGIEHQRERDSTPILSRLHGGYSIGVLGGAMGGAAATAAGIPLLTHFAVVAVALLLLLLVAQADLPGRSRALPPASSECAPAARPWHMVSSALAVIAIAGLLLEGTVTDWSVLLVSRDLAAGPAVGASVVVAFSLAMFVSRSAGDRTVPALGRVRYLTAAGVLATVGATVGLVVPVWWAAYLGLVVVGLVLGPVFPLVIDAAAERSPESAAAATAAVSAVGYLAYLGGPPLVGVLAHRAGLPMTIALVGALCGAALVLAAARVAGDGAEEG